MLAETPYAEGEGDVRITENLRHSRRHPKDAAVLQRVAGRGAPVVTLLYSGRPLYVNDLANKSEAFIAAWQPGTEAPASPTCWLRRRTASPGQVSQAGCPSPGRPVPASSARMRRSPGGRSAGGLSGKEAQASTKPLPEPADPAPICPL